MTKTFCQFSLINYWFSKRSIACLSAIKTKLSGSFRTLGMTSSDDRYRSINGLYRLDLTTLQWKVLTPSGPTPPSCDKSVSWSYKKRLMIIILFLFQNNTSKDRSYLWIKKSFDGIFHIFTGSTFLGVTGLGLSSQVTTTFMSTSAQPTVGTIICRVTTQFWMLGLNLKWVIFQHLLKYNGSVKSNFFLFNTKEASVWAIGKFTVGAWLL